MVRFDISQMNQQLLAATCGGERPNRLDRLSAAVPPHLAATHHLSTLLVLFALPVVELTHMVDSGGSNVNMNDEEKQYTMEEVKEEQPWGSYG